MVKIDEILNNCLKADNGIYYYNKKDIISYPEDGNDECFRVEDESFWFGHRNNCILEILKKSDKKGEIVDIGGGNGFVSKMIQDNGYEVILVEPGNGVINAKKRNIKNIVCGIFDKEIFKKKVSNVGMFDVLEHIEEDKKMLKEIYDVLEFEGNLYITVPAYSFLWSNEDDEAGHFRRYKVKELEKLLNNIGFKVTYSTYLFSFLIFPIFILRVIPSMIGIRKKSNEVKVRKEHIAGKVAKKIVEILCNKEIKKIKRDKKIIFGTSCLIVAKKVKK